jgi:hypothetical protein
MHPAARELCDRIEHGTALTADQWKAALVGTGALSVRSRWPASEPFAISMRPPSWLRLTAMHLNPEDSQLASAEAGLISSGPFLCANGLLDEVRSWRYQSLGSLPVGEHQLVFYLSLVRGHAYRWSGTPEPQEHRAPGGLFFRDRLTFDVEVVPTLDEAIPPSASPEIDAAVRRSLSLAFTEWGDGRSAMLVVDPDIGGDPLLAHLGLSLAIEVLSARHVVEETHFVLSTYDPVPGATSVYSTPQQPCAFGPLETIPLTAEEDLDARSNWTVRVRGTAKSILALWPAETYWHGELGLSLDELIWRERQVAPNGRGEVAWMSMPTFR